jgi:hypothetical protein
VAAAACLAAIGTIHGGKEEMPDKKSERQVYEVAPSKRGGWDVKKEGGERASGHHPTKAEAVVDARQRAKAAPLGQIRVKGTNGQIQTEWTYGKDPRRTRG